MRSPEPRDRRGRRRGFTLLELSATAFLVVAAMTLTVTSLGWTASERARVGRRQVAAREVGNALEKVSGRAWEALATGPLEVSKETSERLPEAAGRLTVAESKPGWKRVRVEVLWREGAGNLAGSGRVGLTTWVARRGEGRP